MVTKTTAGIVFQDFDDKGNLLKQYFKADSDSEAVEYYDDDDNTIDFPDPRADFYAPFDMCQPGD